MKLSEEIQEGLDDDSYAADFAKYTDYEVQIRAELLKLTKFIDSKKTKDIKPSSSSVKTAERSAGKVKLPRFEIKKFNGNPVAWRLFIESFDAAVHGNSDLSDIEKMNFLMNYVEGEAENVIQGLLLSNDNYSVAKTMLEERYGDPQLLISAHMSKLLSLDAITENSDVKRLR